MALEMYQTRDMYKRGQKEELIALKEDPETFGEFGEWDFFYVGRAMYELGRYQALLDLYRTFHARFPESSRMDNQMGWSLYHTKIKNFDFQTGNTEEFRRQAEYVIEHSDASVYSPRWRTLVRLCDATLNGSLGQDGEETARVDGYLDLIDPGTLSTVPGKTKDGRELASDLEKWYSMRIKIKKARGLWDECCDWAEQGLQTVTDLHYGNELWWPNYQAKARMEQQRPAEAKDVMLRAMKGKNVIPWAIHATVFQACKELGEEENALRYAAEAITSPSAEDDKLGNLFNQVAEYLLTLGKKEEACLHRQMTVALYRKNGWTEKERSMDREMPEEIRAMEDPREIRRKLMPVWTGWKEAGRTYYTGQIKNVAQDGKSGFLKGDNGQDYHYSIRDFRNRRVNLEPGLKIRFTLEDRLDRKKNEMKATAVDITVL